MKSKFRVYFETKSQDVEHIEYHLFDTSVTYKWLSVLLNSLSQGSPIGRMIVQKKPSPLTQLHLEEFLLNNVKRAKELISLPFPLKDVEDVRRMDRAQRNRLQRNLNYLIQTFISRPVAWELHESIVNVEDALLSLDPQTTDQKISFKYLNTAEVAMDSEDLNHCTGEELFGDLVLGPSTIGKSLADCYLTEDVELLKESLLHSRQIINTQMILAFPTKNPKPGSAEKFKTEVLNWAQKHLSEASSISLKDPAYTSFLNPKLGELTTRLTQSDVSKVMENISSIVKTEVY